MRPGLGGHGVVGVLHGGQPGSRVAALRADRDALPVKENSGADFASTVVDNDYPDGPFPVAHACGHDCHTAMLMGAAQVLAGMRAQLPGTVLFVFQPAEEGAPIDERAGAKAMLDDGALSRPEPTLVFGMHASPAPMGSVSYATGVELAASARLRIVIRGQADAWFAPLAGHRPPCRWLPTSSLRRARSTARSRRTRP